MTLIHTEKYNNLVNGKWSPENELPEPELEELEKTQNWLKENKELLDTPIKLVEREG